MRGKIGASPPAGQERPQYKQSILLIIETRKEDLQLVVLDLA